MSICVLGGTYFIGRQIVHRLIQRGHQVLSLNRGTVVQVVGAWPILADRSDFGFVQSALANYSSIDTLVDISATEPFEVETIIAALQAPPSRIVYISSGAVYLESDHPCTEHDPVGGAQIWDDYGTKKLACEEVWRKYAEQHGIKLTILRPPYVYGVGNPLDRESWFVARLQAGVPIFIPRSGGVKLQFLHVEDLAEIVADLVEALSPPTGVFNTAAPDHMTFEMLVDVAARVLRAPSQRHVVDLTEHGLTARDIFPFRDYDYLLDVTNMQRNLLGPRGLRYPDTRTGWGEVCFTIGGYHPPLHRSPAEERLGDET